MSQLQETSPRAGASGVVSGGGGANFYTHQIANSVRVPATSNTSSSNGRLTKTFGTVDSSVHWTLNFWIKRSALGGTNPVTSARPLTWFTPRSGTSGSVLNEFKFCSPTAGNTAGDSLMIVQTNSNAIVLSTDNLFRDTSAWYNIHIQADLDNGTNSERLKFFINGTEASYNTDNRGSYTSLSGITAGAWTIGDYHNYGYPIQCYFAQWAYVDGYTHPPTDFGESKNGVWIPKDLSSGITWGSAGHLLMFQDSSALGDDTSGEGNDWAVANIDAHDQMLDSPTFNSDSNANFPTINVLDPTITVSAISEGNLKITEGNGLGGKATFAVPLTGKWYWEAYVNNGAYQEMWAGITGITTNSSGEGRGGSSNATTYGASWSNYSGSNMYIRKYIAGTESAESGSFGPTSDTILGVAINRDDNEAKFYKNNALQFTTAISATQEYFPAGGMGGGNDSSTITVWNFGQSSAFSGNETSQGNADSNGYGDFYYAPPSGHLALCSANLPIEDAVDPAQTDDNYPQKLFSPILYSGNGSTNNIIGLGFQPDWTWIKSNSTAYNHRLWDSSRGVQKYIESDTSDAEATLSTGLTSFDSDGFTLGSGGSQNNSSSTFVAWNWRANGGTTSSNGNGSITSTVQADPSGSFSIVSYTGYSSTWDNMSTVGHGLSSAPDCILLKPLTNIPWEVFFGDLGGTGGGSTAAGNSLVLNTTGALYTNQTYRTWGDVMPTSTVFTVNGNNANAAGVAMIAYCFANTEGYIKSGVYEGNGNADGSFVYCGFRPALIMTKSLDSTSDWQMFDDTRLGYNVDNNALVANTNAAKTTTDMIDILSNGFKMRIATDPNVAETYVYLAIAKNPFQFATAR